MYLIDVSKYSLFQYEVERSMQNILYNLASVDDVQKGDIHYRVTNWEDDYDQQRIEQHVCQLLWLVQHILLELQVLNQLNDQCDHVHHHTINDKNHADNY